MIIFEVPHSSTQTPSVQHNGSTQGPHLFSTQKPKNPQFNQALSFTPKTPQFHLPLSSTPKTHFELRGLELRSFWC